MTFHQKNTAVTLVSFSLLLIIFLIRVSRLVRTDNFNDSSVIRLWIFVVGFAVIVTVAGIILTFIATAAIEAAQTGNDDIEIDDTIDERDQLIDLKGTKITYTITSLGSFFAIMAFALGQSALVMITLLLFLSLIHI